MTIFSNKDKKLTRNFCQRLFFHNYQEHLNKIILEMKGYINFLKKFNKKKFLILKKKKKKIIFHKKYLYNLKQSYYIPSIIEYFIY